MIRRLLSLLICAGGLLLVTACNSEENKENAVTTEKNENTAAVSQTTEAQEKDIIALSANEVYFFYQETCPHCHEAAAYLHEKHPNAKIKALNIKMPGNMKLFADAVKTYKIGNMAGTPLICFGQNYVMGWSEEDQKMLDLWIKDYTE